MPSTSPGQLAAELADRARRLAARALVAVREDPDLRTAWAELEQSAVPEDTELTDAYAQIVGYGLLAARSLVDGEFTRARVVALLRRASPVAHRLFARLLDSALAADIEGIIAWLARVPVIHTDYRDPSIHFYQDFLDAYDPQLRKRRGVYYTPDEIVAHVVDTTHAALAEHLGLRLGLADTTKWAEFAARRGTVIPPGIPGDAPFVQILDPAMGTGIFMIRIIELVHATMMAEYSDRGLAPEAARRTWVDYVRADLLPRLSGFELMPTAFVVSHLRIGLALRETGFEFGEHDRLRVTLANALEQRVGQGEAISVMIGNPPYEREPADGAALPDQLRALLDDYLEPARAAGAGAHLKNAYNLYVYFWRWAIARVFERFESPGIVAFVTASSYVQGPGFVGMREHLRRVADEIYILDLEGDQRGARASDNVFDIMTPVCVATVIATGQRALAVTRYHRVSGDRQAKLAACREWRRLSQIPWARAPGAPGAPLMSAGSEAYQSWPRVTDLWPWQHSGAQFKRTWPIASEREVLERRWAALVGADAADQAALFRQTRDRKPATFVPDSPTPRIARIGFRSWDRQWCLADTRVGDFIRPVLWRIASDRQIYLTSHLAGVIGAGPAATISAFVPDLHHYCGRGGKDVIPLWRDAAASRANVAAAFIDALSEALGQRPESIDIFAYLYAILANPGYVARFEDELRVPGPRLPVTCDLRLFQRGAELGRALLCWHTYGERLRGDDFELGGRAQVTRAVPAEPYPERHEYDAEARTLKVGDGEIVEVAPELWSFRVSGLQVLKSWLDYRMKSGAGRRSSALDSIRSARWTAAMTRELLELLWVLEWTLAQYPILDAWLDEVLAGPLLSAAELAPPTAAERKPPGC